MYKPNRILMIKTKLIRHSLDGYFDKNGVRYKILPTMWGKIPYDDSYHYVNIKNDRIIIQVL